MTRTPEQPVHEYPLLPLRDVVVFPHMVVPLFVGRDKSIQALEAAMEGSKEILLVAQKDPATDEPGPKDVFSMGTLATVLQMLRLPDGTVKVLVEGNARASIDEIEEGEYLTSRAVVLDDEPLQEQEEEVLTRTLMDEFEKYVKLSKKVPSEVSNALTGIEELDRLVDTMASHLEMRIPEKQELLEAMDLRTRVDLLMGKLDGEIDLIEVEKRIRGRVKKQMERSQREYYLNEQMKAIQKEMGNLGEGSNDFEELEQKLEEAKLPEEAKKKTEAELNKLKMMSPMSAEATVVRGYIDWMLSIPWKKRSRVRHDLDKAREILDEDHYGLDEVKTRILEYLAVQSRVKKIKGPVLCLVGPPGVGKTSLGQSIARATNRKYTRMALGGVRDEAEIRGHRKTYIGALPGKLIQKLSKVGVKNPLFLFDEIDKMGMDHRGDPASALLEVLDPEQNHTFNDHYLEVDYDLSDVMFVCTSNSMNIPPALLDRMEIIRIPGYTEDEKVNIALRYLLPKQIKANGLRKDELEMPESTVRDLIRYYTREAGVRGLEREIAKICRKVVRENVEKKEQSTLVLKPEMLEDYSGVKRFNFGLAEEKNQIGQVTGLAWTSVGGELLTIEAALTPGKGRVVKTGSLGDVMQESIQTALTVVRSRAAGLGIADDFHEKHDLHIHVPEGATPKDGPSAGIGMCTALVSALTRIPIRADVAMTGEITLRGRVLAIGGLKEKLLAAHRGGIKTVLIPDENVRDLKEIPANVKESLEIRPVKWIDEVLDIALEYPPEPSAVEAASDSGSSKPGDESTDAAERINTH
ncbi:ATP-dependent proteinase. Serine peptidase. MEROPS family S16 [Marinobacter persicus]|uniref:Lon protease n=1 Tax=Marinobacter persicus TaxID=930118 RepID=A0A1I3TMC3_9GAMM|nr:endopeptidase La [Marinobacter persicus]GHD46440.1 Lon protease [Marinobacter persicus]SFJ70687.1 ATP-dependent proteinase. Serine peptidase. MEROPS family S16 [Marinobacter persicus]